jgi:hypothetical protein
MVDLPGVVGYLLPDLASIPADVGTIRREVLTYLHRRSLISIICTCCNSYRVKSLSTARPRLRLSSGVGCGRGRGAGGGGSKSGGGGVVKPFTTFAYNVPFVLAFVFVLATPNSRFDLLITLWWSRSRYCCCCCPGGCCRRWVLFPFPAWRFGGGLPRARGSSARVFWTYCRRSCRRCSR